MIRTDADKRATPEWIGKTPDDMPPPRVRLRIFQAHGGRCYRSGRLIRAGDKWALDHIIAIINGGQNRESNLAPILEDSHKDKTAEDLVIKSKTYRMAAKNAGVWPKPTRKIAQHVDPWGKQRRKASQDGREPREGAKLRATNKPQEQTS